MSENDKSGRTFIGTIYGNLEFRLDDPLHTLEDITKWLAENGLLATASIPDRAKDEEQ